MHLPCLSSRAASHCASVIRSECTGELIHQSFECPLWLERICVYLGTLVGMAGPYRHDPPARLPRLGAAPARVPRLFLSPRRLLARRLVADALPARADASARVPARSRGSPTTGSMPSSSARGCCSRLPWALLFFALGGWSWLVWGICVRVSRLRDRTLADRAFRASPGRPDLGGRGRLRAGLQRAARRFHQHGRELAQQSPRLPELGQARVVPGQIDLGWWLIKAFEALGLAWNIKTPADLPHRPGLRRLPEAEPCVPALVGLEGECR